jgi:transposase
MCVSCVCVAAMASLDALAAAAAADAPASPPRDVRTPPPPGADPRSPYSRLTEKQRWSVVVWYEEGLSNSEIAKKLGVHRHTVREAWKRYKETGSPASGSRSGRPRITDAETNHAIELTARIDKFTSARRIATDLYLDISHDTVNRRLNEVGLVGRVARERRQYTADEKRKRLSFAEGYQHWTAEQWETVWFSDEKTFYGWGHSGQVWVRRERGEANALLPENTVHKQAHPVKLGAWGCFCAAGLGYLRMYEENMDAVLMKSTLETELMPSVKLYFDVDHAAPWHLLHDNDKKFKSTLVSEWLHNKGISVLDFPPYSPDLNPIENLWHFMQERVDKQPTKTRDELEVRIREEWTRYDRENKDTIRNLARSMVERCQAVIEAKGNATKY